MSILMNDTLDFVFNVLDWHEFDEIPSNDDIQIPNLNIQDQTNIPNIPKKIYDYEKKYVIKAFGRMENFESVYLRIEGFPPHFYVLLPESFNAKLDQICEHLVNILKSKNSNLEHTLEKYEIVKRKKLYGFCAGKKFNFLRLVFSNKKSMMDASRIFDNKICLFSSSVNKLGIKDRYIKFDVYESNIDPYIRFMHIQNLVSCGWLRISKSNIRPNYEETTCDHAYTVNWCDISPANLTNIAPFYICSFDLECTSSDGGFPQASREGDRIIQIGFTFTKYGSSDIVKQIMISLGTCDPIPNTELIVCKTEYALLLEFQKVIQREDPDILTGYNIFSFDQPYLMDRAKLLKLPEKFYYMSKLKNYKCQLITKNLSSSALGDNKLNYINSVGRVHIDLMKVVQRDYKLDSYKLDSVAESFFKDKVSQIIQISQNSQNIDPNTDVNLDLEFKVKSKSIQILKLNNYVRFDVKGEVIMSKYKITDINYDEGWFIVKNLNDQIVNNKEISWGMVKDDIKPRDIFELYEKTSADRSLIGIYCIQDCALVSKLIAKLEIITNNISMASVCHVPLHYIFFRGQGIKSLSLVAKFCRSEGYLIPVMKKQSDEELENCGYDGATVFEPEIGFHRKPIPVLDYNSLYPSSIISKNVSHETLVTSPEYDNLPGYIYYDVNYNNHDGTQTHCRYAKKVDQYLETDPAKTKFGIIPTILMGLLLERKMARKELEKEPDQFKKKIWDGKQNALKITANSIYGQLGAPTSPIYFKHGAASTTAIGRDMLCLAKEFTETKIKDILESLYNAQLIADNTQYESIIIKHLKERDAKFEEFLKVFVVELFDNYLINPHVVYGDTDSIFIKFDLKNKSTNEDIYDKSTLDFNINLGKCTSRFLKSLLPYPHNMEYEKTFHPFAIMAKKKYIGNKFEHDPNSFKQVSMGVVLKRRDNAHIVKRIVGGMVDIMMNENDIDKTIRFIKKSINDLLKGKYDIHEFITSKTLKANYVDRNRLAHVVLADRMKLRDPGNAPQLNDRIPFVAIETPERKGVKILQGERIEHPDYIFEHKLKIDYLFYLTNQIMNPSTQFLELMMKPAEANKLFNDFIMCEQDKRRGRQPLSKFGIKKVNVSILSQNNEFDFDILINDMAKPNNNVISKKNTQNQNQIVNIDD
jgi:DNA polymerase elongation subunit (family B)